MALNVANSVVNSLRDVLDIFGVQSTDIDTAVTEQENLMDIDKMVNLFG
jgi:3-oxoacyl-[acyl-carrier-protein] synthase III